MRETFHKWGIGKRRTERHWKRITVAQGRINLQEQPIYLKTCSSDIHSILNYVSFSPRTGLKPLLTVRKPIKNPVLLPTFLQIYCIGLIGLVTHFLWIWTAICDPIIPIQYHCCECSYILHACKISRKLKINSYVINKLFKLKVFIV